MELKASSSVGDFFVNPANSWLIWSMQFTISSSLSGVTKLKRSEEIESERAEEKCFPAAVPSLVMFLLCAFTVPTSALSEILSGDACCGGCDDCLSDMSQDILAKAVKSVYLVLYVTSLEKRLTHLKRSQKVWSLFHRNNWNKVRPKY